MKQYLIRKFTHKVPFSKTVTRLSSIFEILNIYSYLYQQLPLEKNDNTLSTPRLDFTIAFCNEATSIATTNSHKGIEIRITVQFQLNKAAELLTNCIGPPLLNRSINLVYYISIIYRRKLPIYIEENYHDSSDTKVTVFLIRSIPPQYFYVVWGSLFTVCSSRLDLGVRLRPPGVTTAFRCRPLATGYFRGL